MPVPLPTDDQALRVPPDAAEVAVLGRGVLAAVTPPGARTALQEVLIGAMFEAMTGHPVDLGAEPLEPEAFAEALARRDEAFRTRIVQVMLLGAMVLTPLPEAVADQVEAYARALSVDDGMLAVTRRFAQGSLGLAAIDFQRNGYEAGWDSAHAEVLGTSRALDDAWVAAVADDALAARWTALGELPEGTLGKRVWQFYRARGFAFPGQPGSAPPLLAQHDWVHVLADYGTTVECELEVFGLIARANDDPRAFSLLAMVVSLFETGYLATGAGLFAYDRGHLSRRGVPVRLADAMRRGALMTGSVDLLAMDWWGRADQPVEDVRRELGLVPRSDAALAAGSVTAWERGGISSFQLAAGRAAAEAAGRAYEPFGASVGDEPAPGT